MCADVAGWIRVPRLVPGLLPWRPQRICIRAGIRTPNENVGEDILLRLADKPQVFQSCLAEQRLSWHKKFEFCKLEGYIKKSLRSRLRVASWDCEGSERQSEEGGR